MRFEDVGGPRGRGLGGGGARMGGGDLSARPWHVPRFVAVACGGNGPPCRGVNIVYVCVCACWWWGAWPPVCGVCAVFT